MKGLKTKIAALAKLDKTPEEIMAETRAKLEGKIAEREKWNKSWWRRYAHWRSVSLENGEENEFILLSSLVFVCAQITILIHAVAIGVPFTSLFIFFVIFGFLGRIKKAQDSGDAIQCFWYLLRYFILPIMPLVRILDLIISRKVKRFGLCYGVILTHGAVLTRGGIVSETASSNVAELVSVYYAEGIEQARAELLGETSELRVTAADLDKRLERVDGQLVRLNARLSKAIGDASRAKPLTQAIDALGERRSCIKTAINRVRETIAKTNAVLDECKVAVSKLREPLEDAILIGEIERESEGDTAAITSAHRAVDTHVENIRSKLIQLATAVTSPTLVLPAAGQEESLEEYFERVDRVAEKVNAI